MEFSKKYFKHKYLEYFARFYSDRKFLEMYFPMKMGYKLDLDNPKSMNEKLNWIKINDRKPQYVRMVDKVEAKKYIAEKLGTDKYIIPTLGVYNTVDEIDISKLPDQFVLKCTHDSGGVVICEGKDKFDWEKGKTVLAKGLKKNYFWLNREWPYKQVKPRIIAEEYKVDESGWQLKDYKVFCFNGVPKFVEVDYDRYVGHKLNVYDLDWNYIDFYMTSHNDPNVKIGKPEKLKEMLEVAKKLSEGTYFLRVDFYSIYSELYVGELTLTPGSGMIGFYPKEYDWKVGEMLKLPIDK